MKLDEHRLGDPIDHADGALEAALAEICACHQNVRFGSVEIIIHDSRVVQIERKENVRFAASPRTKVG
jgi:hypothetical protein